MPFDEEDSKDFTPKLGLKPVGGQKSIFENKVAKPSQQDFQKKVQESQEKLSGYKKRASDLFIKFNQIISDKTLVQNKNVFSNEVESELLQNMIQLAIEINNDPNEKEGMGSLTWITLLFKTCLSQRDRLNNIEYQVSLLSNKLDTKVSSEFVKKEILQALDIKKDSE